MSYGSGYGPGYGPGYSRVDGEPQAPSEGTMGGVAIDGDGVVQTTFLADDESVPAGAIFLGGIAHNASGLRYVAGWPTSNEVYYRGGIAVRADGAMIIASSGGDVSHNGGALTDRGEVIVSTSAPQVVLGGFGMRQDGSLCVSEAA